MPHDPYRVTGSTAGYGVQYDTTTACAGTSCSSNILYFYATSAITQITGTMTNCVGQQGFFLNNAFTYGAGGGGSHPVWEPVQAEALRKDWKALHESFARKRAEVRGKRFFRRVVGEKAWKRYEEKGYHEILGASGTRYRLRPGFRVQVMEEGDTVGYELCAHLEIGIPWHDSMAVQHLMLTSSKETEDQFRSAANRHRAHGPYPVPELTEAA